MAKNEKEQEKGGNETPATNVPVKPTKEEQREVRGTGKVSLLTDLYVQWLSGLFLFQNDLGKQIIAIDDGIDTN